MTPCVTTKCHTLVLKDDRRKLTQVSTAPQKAAVWRLRAHRLVNNANKMGIERYMTPFWVVPMTRARGNQRIISRKILKNFKRNEDMINLFATGSRKSKAWVVLTSGNITTSLQRPVVVKVFLENTITHSEACNG